MNPTPFGGGDDASLLTSLWEYLRQSTTVNHGTGVQHSATISSPPNERTSLLGGNGHSSSPQAGRSANNVLDDIFPYESPEFVQRSLQQLEQELQLIQFKHAYQLALVQQQQQQHQSGHDESSYINDDLRLAFLRAERYHPPKAALRMVAFFEEKRRLFGDAVVGRRILLKDFSRDDWASLQSGALQFVAEMGDATTARITMNRQLRAIFCYFPKYQVYATPDNMIRAWWYLVQCVLLDSTAVAIDYQKNGVVGVVHHMGGGGFSDLDRTLWWQGLCSLKQLPIRFGKEGIHFCFDDYKIRHAVSLYRATFPYLYGVGKSGGGEDTACRWHEGSFTECKYRLLQSGIPFEALPITEDGQLLRTRHLEWLNHRMELESGT